MSHDDIKAALAKVNPTGEQWCIWNGWGPLVGTENIHAATRIGTSDEDSGVHGRWTEDGDLYGSRDTLEFVASAPTWLAELLAENESLARWKTEALPVIAGLQELGAALGIPLGKRVTGPDALEAVKALAARAEAAEQTIQRVRAIHYAADNDLARTPVCSNCEGKAGVHDCGCWADEDRQPVCGHCNEGWKGASVPWPCATVRALDGGEQHG